MAKLVDHRAEAADGRGRDYARIDPAGRPAQSGALFQQGLVAQHRLYTQLDCPQGHSGTCHVDDDLGTLCLIGSSDIAQEAPSDRGTHDHADRATFHAGVRVGFAAGVPDQLGLPALRRGKKDMGRNLKLWSGFIPHDQAV